MSRVTKAALGVAAGAAGLDAATAQGRFRRSLLLAIPTGGGAHGAAVAEGAVLGVTFLAREVDALAPGAPEAASLSAGGAGLVLSLPVAREVARVRLNAPQAGDQIAAFRFDGAAVSDDPVAVAAHAAAGAGLSVTDRALILRRRNAGDHALAPSAIAAVVLRYPPANPRLLVALHGDPAGEQALPPVTGEGGAPVFPAAMSRGEALRAVLQAAVSRLAEGAGTLPDPLTLDLILEADQPCSARVDALDIALRLERRGFAGEPGKRVLRFGGGRREAQAVELALPHAAVDLEGTMGVSVTGAPAAGRAASDGTALPSAGAEGVALTAGGVVAGRLMLPAAAVVTGAEVVLAAAEPRTALQAWLRADRDGHPDAVLATGAELAVKSAAPAPVPIAFPATVVPAGPVWLSLSVTRGAAVAMLDGGGDVIASGDGTEFAPLPAAAGHGLAAALRLAVAPVTAEAGLVLDMGGTVLPVADGVADLGPALAGALAPVLGVSADFRAVVTLDPPVLRYSLGS